MIFGNVALVLPSSMQFTFQNGQESRKWLTIQICHVLNAWEAKKPLYGTKNLSKGAKTRVRVLADIQNFALRAHCVRTACALRAWHSQTRTLTHVEGIQDPTTRMRADHTAHTETRVYPLQHDTTHKGTRIQSKIQIVVQKTN